MHGRFGGRDQHGDAAAVGVDAERYWRLQLAAARRVDYAGTVAVLCCSSGSGGSVVQQWCGSSGSMVQQLEEWTMQVLWQYCGSVLQQQCGAAAVVMLLVAIVMVVMHTAPHIDYLPIYIYITALTPAPHC